MKEKYDLIVIGGGPGGYVAAIKAAKAGLDTALVEQRDLGGTCLNRGCIPAKAMIHASEVYRQAIEADRFGVEVEGAGYDYSKILEYKKDTVDQLVGGVEKLLESNGVDVLSGHGRLLGASDGLNRVELSPACGGEKVVIAAENVVLATGSRPATIPVKGMDLPGVLDSDGLFALEHAPKSIIIIGGGVIGVEFATVFSNLGCRVTIIEALPRILDNFDKEISQNLKMILKKRGVDIHSGATVNEIRKNEGSDGPSDEPSNNTSDDLEDALTCVFVEKDKECAVSAQYVLCAVGRSPVTDDLFGEDVIGEDGDEDVICENHQDDSSPRIRMNGRFVKVDKNYATDMPGVYAIGDLTGGIMLAHAASAHGIRAVEHIVATRDGAADSVAFAEGASQNLDIIPGCVYTDPEIATVGMDEARAKDEGREVIVGKFIMTANGKSLVTKEERGFIKVIAEAGTERILGAQMMCARATDMIGEFTTAIVNEMTVHDMLRGIRAHPTYNEAIAEALEDAVGESTHTIPRRR